MRAVLEDAQFGPEVLIEVDPMAKSSGDALAWCHETKESPGVHIVGADVMLQPADRTIVVARTARHNWTNEFDLTNLAGRCLERTSLSLSSTRIRALLAEGLIHHTYGPRARQVLQELMPQECLRIAPADPDERNAGHAETVVTAPVGRGVAWTPTEQLQVYGTGYKLLQKMGHQGAGESDAPLVAARRYGRTGVQEDEGKALEWGAEKAFLARPSPVRVQQTQQIVQSMSGASGSADLPSHDVDKVKNAELARGSKAKDWWSAARPRGRGRKAPMADKAREDFPALFEQWLQQRGLHDMLVRDLATETKEKAEHTQGQEKGLRRWHVYKLKQGEQVDSSWTQAFHGTWWYALDSILRAGKLLESTDAALGHDYWEPGTYCTPLLQTALWYSRPHITFGDNVYNRVVIELAVNRDNQRRSRERGGVQWVFASADVRVVGVRCKTNAPPKVGEERLTAWDPMLEAITPGRQPLQPIVNPKQYDDMSVCGEDRDGVHDVVSESDEENAYIDSRLKVRKITQTTEVVRPKPMPKRKVVREPVVLVPAERPADQATVVGVSSSSPSPSSVAPPSPALVELEQGQEAAPEMETLSSKLSTIFAMYGLGIDRCSDYLASQPALSERIWEHVLAAAGVESAVLYTKVLSLPMRGCLLSFLDHPYFGEAVVRRMYADHCLTQRAKRVLRGRLTLTQCVYSFLRDLDEVCDCEFSRAQDWLMAQEITLVMLGGLMVDLDLQLLVQARAPKELAGHVELTNYLSWLSSYITAADCLDGEHLLGCDCQHHRRHKVEVEVEPQEVWTMSHFFTSIAPVLAQLWNATLISLRNDSSMKVWKLRLLCTFQARCLVPIVCTKSAIARSVMVVLEEAGYEITTLEASEIPCAPELTRNLVTDAQIRRRALTFGGCIGVLLTADIAEAHFVCGQPDAFPFPPMRYPEYVDTEKLAFMSTIGGSIEDYAWDDATSRIPLVGGGNVGHRSASKVATPTSLNFTRQMDGSGTLVIGGVWEKQWRHARSRSRRKSVLRHLSPKNVTLDADSDINHGGEGKCEGCLQNVDINKYLKVVAVLQGVVVSKLFAAGSLPQPIAEQEADLSSGDVLVRKVHSCVQDVDVVTLLKVTSVFLEAVATQILTVDKVRVLGFVHLSKDDLGSARNIVDQLTSIILLQTPVRGRITEDIQEVVVTPFSDDVYGRDDAAYGEVAVNKAE
eukprot:1151545-Amphidinium_carterae.1